MKEASNMDVAIRTVPDCDNKRRMDKKHMVLNKYFAENGHAINGRTDFVQSTFDPHEMRYFPPLSPMESQCISAGARRKERFHEDLQQDDFIRKETLNFEPKTYMKTETHDFDNAGFMKNESDFQLDHLDHSRLNNQICHPNSLSNDFMPPIDTLKIANDYGDTYPQSHSYVKHETNEQFEGSLHLYPESDRNYAQEYWCDSLGPRYSPCEDSLCSQDQSDSHGLMGMGMEYNYGLSPMHPQSHWSNEYLHPAKHPELSNGLDDGDEEPLDLTVAKEGTQFNSLDQEYFEHSADFPLREGSEESVWLKKIKTGTRSRVRSPKSWEFLLRLLMDSQSNPSMIKWEDIRSGTFRLVQKDKIAKIWGMRSSKRKDGELSYDNFARNLRYHYKTKMLLPVSEKHLVYRFSEEVMERRNAIVNQS